MDLPNLTQVGLSLPVSIDDVSVIALFGRGVP